MNRRPTLLLLLLSVVLGSQAIFSCPVTEVDSLLKAYDRQKGQQRRQTAGRLLATFGESAVFFGDTPRLSPALSSDEQDLTVWFGAVRFLTTSSYFREALALIDRVQPLVSRLAGRKSELPVSDWQATLLCDKCYGLFKTSDYSQAIAVGKKAVETCQQQENWMQLSRAYLYLTIVNHGLRNYDEALRLVEKAIATNERLGMNVQTHNALGVACELYCSANQPDRAVSYGLRAVEAARAIGYQQGVANHLTQLSYAYDKKGDYAKGLEAADQAIRMVRAAEPLDRNQLAIALEFKAWNLIDAGRHAEALREAIAMENAVGNRQAVCYDYRTLAEALEPLDQKAALAALKSYVRMKDSLHTEELKELTTKANADLHVDDLQEENAESRRENRLILIASFAIIQLLVVAIATLWYALRQKRQKAAMLQRLTTVREEFFTNVTHELRTPLTVILGISEELTKTTPPFPLSSCTRRATALSGRAASCSHS